MTLPDGTAAWYRSQMSPYHNGEGTSGVILVAENVTELRQAREAAKVSHGLCEDCYRRQMQGLDGSDESGEQPA